MYIISIGSKYKFIPLELEKLKAKVDYIKEDELSKIDENSLVILNLDNPSKDLINRLKKDNINFITLEEFLEKYLKKIYISDNFNCTLKPYSKFQYFIKRVIDFSIVIPLGIVTIPIMLYSTYRIKKESPDGPIIFKQERVGKNEKTFICYKFRSMRTDIDFFHHYTQENDPRIFKWGAFMRKTRIDELPQLFNVIKGDLHIIGPRAEWIELVKKYEQKWPHYHFRHINAPGITGWAQVNYPYGKNLEDTYQKLMYDLYYIKNWSLWLEIKTIFKTIWVMCGGKGV